jgi:PleD family two-component response regulator
MLTTNMTRPPLIHKSSVGDILKAIEIEDAETEKTVLVVDDDTISRTVLSKLLHSLNFKGKSY